MSRKISMSQAINEAMAIAMRKDENVILDGRRWQPAVQRSIICRMTKHGVAS